MISPALAIAALGFLISCQQSALAIGLPEIQDKNYEVVIDCGSSGTRALIFELTSSPLTNSHPQLLNGGAAEGKSVHPGLSRLAGQSRERVSNYMKPIYEFIADTIPVESHVSATRILIVGTAGLRMLNEATQTKLLNMLVADLQLNFGFPTVQAEVISGPTEGMYQWITMNSKSWLNNEASLETASVMEMGGTSAQVTFRLTPRMFAQIQGKLEKNPEALQAFASQITEPNVGENVAPYKLVSISFLGLGSNSVRRWHADYLIKKDLMDMSRLKGVNESQRMIRFRDQHEPIEILNPCMNREAVVELEKPLRMLASPKTIGFSLEAADEAFKVKLVGSGSYEQCRFQLSQVLDLASSERVTCSSSSSNEPCSLSLVGIPFIPYDLLKFVGASDFFYTTKGILNLPGNLNLKELVRKTKEACAMSKSELMLLFPKTNPSKSTETCYKAIWLELFLTKVVRMPEDFDGLTPVGSFAGTNAEWTPGAVLNSLRATIADDQTLVHA